MLYLTAMKRTVDLTNNQIAAWYGVLRVFPIWVLNKAILVVCLSDTRFPDIGDVYQQCRSIAKKAGLCKEDYSNTKGWSNSELETIASSIGLKVTP